METAACVTSAFAACGYRLVVVGGTAIEFYTEGAYMSGDIGLCRKDSAPIPLRNRREIMAGLGAAGDPRSWKLSSQTSSVTWKTNLALPCERSKSPSVGWNFVPPELLIVERALSATFAGSNTNDELCARKLMAVCLHGKVPVDWKEVDRLARLPSFRVADEVNRLKAEVSRVLG